MVGWCEGFVYLTSPGCPTDIGLQWARPAILVAGKGRGGRFLFLLFLHFHSCSSFCPAPLFHLLYYLFYLFSPFLWEMTQTDPQVLTCRKTPTQSVIFLHENVLWKLSEVLLMSIHNTCWHVEIRKYYVDTPSYQEL